jgi:hypothetical protein
MDDAKCREIVEAIGELEVSNPVIEEDAKAIASLFKGCPHLFMVLDEKPGRFGYETWAGKSWHWNLRQARNRFYPTMSKIWRKAS